MPIATILDLGQTELPAQIISITASRPTWVASSTGLHLYIFSNSDYLLALWASSLLFISRNFDSVDTSTVLASSSDVSIASLALTLASILLLWRHIFRWRNIGSESLHTDSVGQNLLTFNCHFLVDCWWLGISSEEILINFFLFLLLWSLDFLRSLLLTLNVLNAFT